MMVIFAQSYQMYNSPCTSTLDQAIGRMLHSSQLNQFENFHKSIKNNKFVTVIMYGWMYT